MRRAKPDDILMSSSGRTVAGGLGMCEYEVISALFVDAGRRNNNLWQPISQSYITERTDPTFAIEIREMV